MQRLLVAGVIGWLAVAMPGLFSTGSQSVAVVLTAGLVASAVAHLAAVGLLVAERLGGRELAGRRGWAAVVAATGGLAAWPVTHDRSSALLVAGLLAALALAAVIRLSRFFVSGALVLATNLALLGFGVPWAAWFVLTMPVSATTRTLALLGSLLAVAGLPVMLVRTFENLEVLCRREWRRPRHPLPDPARRQWPRVAVHVPAHSEPPDVVIATLETLACLDYPNFEVMVIDNNTIDEALWRPVEARCAELGERFRFFHVEGITGAKAGALNFALARTAPDVELVAVVDADYQVEPDFLAATVAHFDDPDTGFVQAPHAYREWGDSAYLRMCAFEYAYFFLTGMASLNERDAGITVGTMSVIRRQALADAGGWAEWCLTEDSELAVRIHALGYSGVYLPTVYGRGLIPETFEGYKKQRFRWTYGPVTELKHHLRLYLPGRRRQPSRLRTAQRVHHATHGLYGMATGLASAMLPVGAAAAASMALHGEVVSIPPALLLSGLALFPGGLVLRWLVYRAIGGARLGDILGAMVAAAALGHVVAVANLWALVGREAHWRRTDKFRRPGRGAAALGAVRTELVVGLSCIVLAIAVSAALPAAGIATAMALGILFQGLTYLAAPLMTVLAERDLRRRARPVTGPKEAALIAA